MLLALLHLFTCLCIEVTHYYYSKKIQKQHVIWLDVIIPGFPYIHGEESANCQVMNGYDKR